MRIEYDRRKDLDPVSDQLAVAGHARPPGFGIGPQPSRSLARHQPRLAVGRAGSHRLKRFRNPPCDELVAASGVWSLVEVHRPLAGLASVVPGLLPGHQLGEAMRPVAVGRHAAVELATVAGLAVVAVEADPRTRMLGAWAGRLRHAPRLPPRRHPVRRSYGRGRTECSVRSDGGAPASQHGRAGPRLTSRGLAWRGSSP